MPPDDKPLSLTEVLEAEYANLHELISGGETEEETQNDYDRVIEKEASHGRRAAHR